MEYFYGTGEDLFLLFVLIVMIVFFIIFVFYFYVVMPFIEERNYIKMEMQRSDDEEYYYWKRELKRLYLSQIPIIGILFR